MEITIRLLAGYRRFLPNGHGAGQDPHHDTYSQDVAPGATVDAVLSTLTIPPGEAFTFLVNGRHAERQQSLQAGDVLIVFPAVGGG
jgi:sulfur carrier protein ThiS